MISTDRGARRMTHTPVATAITPATAANTLNAPATNTEPTPMKSAPRSQWRPGESLTTTPVGVGVICTNYNLPSVAEVVRFPPLPRLPEPPAVGPDDRQRSYAHIADVLASSLTLAEGSVATSNTSRGFRASAVDLGALQNAMTEALAAFDMTQVRQRWDEDLFAWMCRLVLTWVQRCKDLRFELAENGVRVTLVTQDDQGYYRYEFDVFPARATATHNSQPATSSPLPSP